MVRLVLAGDAQSRDRYSARLAAVATKAGVGDRVVVPGRVNPADVPTVMAAADIVVVASTAEEAFGRAAVEAQAAGRPVIATGHGALVETVLAPPKVPAAKRTGWHVPPDNATLLADAISEALALSGEDQEALGARARTNAARFSLKRMTAATLAAYGRLLGRRM
jgi:glycosyltransferase involved in cell wall biosynthesis